jgi:hypothetical protein
MANLLSMEALLTARRGAKDPRDWSAIAPAFRAQLEAKLATLPYNIVGDTIKQEKMQAVILNEKLLAGVVESLIEPTVAKKGEVSADLAEQIAALHFVLRVLLPLNKEMVGVYQAYLDKHKQSKPDIWAERAIALPKDGKYTPVAIAIWDTGVDEALFASQFAGGIAYDLDSKRTTGLRIAVNSSARRPTSRLRLGGPLCGFYRSNHKRGGYLEVSIWIVLCARGQGSAGWPVAIARPTAVWVVTWHKPPHEWAARQAVAACTEGLA